MGPTVPMGIPKVDPLAGLPLTPAPKTAEVPVKDLPLLSPVRWDDRMGALGGVDFLRGTYILVENVSIYFCSIITSFPLFPSWVVFAESNGLRLCDVG